MTTARGPHSRPFHPGGVDGAGEPADSSSALSAGARGAVSGRPLLTPPDAGPGGRTVGSLPVTPERSTQGRNRRRSLLCIVRDGCDRVPQSLNKLLTWEVWRTNASDLYHFWVMVPVAHQQAEEAANSDGFSFLEQHGAKTL